MKKKLFLIGLFSAALSLPCSFFLPFFVSAMEWPVSELAPVRLFGQRSLGSIERGITFEKADTVHASGHGILLLTLEQNRNMDNFPGTLGNSVILAHDDGLLSIYGNLGEIDRIREQVKIDSLSLIAITGQSGWGNSGDLLFQVVDTEKKNFLNPLMLLPSLKDTHGPSIKNVIAVSQQNQLYPFGSVKSIRQGKYRLYADITDSVDKSSTPLSPFRISVLINGSEYLTMPFEVLKQDKGRVFLYKSDFTFEKLYSDPERIYLGEITLTRGRSDISIIARDTAGNERSVLFGLQID
jgi:hypothetical protein